MPSRRSPALPALLALLGACQPAEQVRGWECIAPANPGGGWDLTCRAVGQALVEAGIPPGPVRTVNRPGAGGGVAFAHTVGRRQGDGSVLVAASPATTLRLAQGQYGRLTETDVRWIGAIGTEYGIVAVASGSPWRTLPDLMDAWRADPAAVVSSGGSAVAGQDHMKLLLLAREAGLEPRLVRYVPFDGGGEAMTALLGRFVHVFSGEASEVEGQLAAGNLRILAVLAGERLGGELASVPTAREQGFDVVWPTWRGFYVPGGLEEARYAAWAEDLGRLAGSEAWDRVRGTHRLREFTLTGEAFERFVYEQVEEFRELSRDLGLIR